MPTETKTMMVAFDYIANATTFGNELGSRRWCYECELCGSRIIFNRIRDGNGEIDASALREIANKHGGIVHGE